MIAPVSEDAKKVLHQVGLTEYETRAYLILLKQGVMTASEISEHGKIPYSKVYETLNSLEKKGFLKRMKDPSDRRVNRLVLTEEGKSVVSKAYPLMLKRYEFFVNSISKKELDKITPVLEKLYRSIKSQYKKELGR